MIINWQTISCGNRPQTFSLIIVLKEFRGTIYHSPKISNATYEIFILYLICSRKEACCSVALSHAPTSSSTLNDDVFQAEVEMYVNIVIQSIPATEKGLRKSKKLEKMMKIVRSYFNIVRPAGHTNKVFLVLYSHTFRWYQKYLLTVAFY